MPGGESRGTALQRNPERPGFPDMRLRPPASSDSASLTASPAALGAWPWNSPVSCSTTVPRDVYPLGRVMWVDLTRGGLHGQRRSEPSVSAVEAHPDGATGRRVCPQLCSGGRCPARGQHADSPPPRSSPACADAGILPRALVRRRPAGPRAPAFRPEGRQNGPLSFPWLLVPSVVTRRVRWRWGACASRRQPAVSHLPEEPWPQLDPAALPVTHPRRVRGPAGWPGPGERHAGCGRAAVPGAWFSSVRLALQTDLGARLVRT